MHKLQLCVNKDEPNSFEMTGLTFHQDVLNQKRLIPCLTTPAPTDAGRPIPKRMKGPTSPEVKQRWLEGGKQYAPWIYEAHGMVYEASGQGQLLPAELKEQLHHYPAGFTRHSKLKPRDRHRLLGNSWHLGVARPKPQTQILIPSWRALGAPRHASGRALVTMRKSCGEAFGGHVGTVGTQPAYHSPFDRTPSRRGGHQTDGTSSSGSMRSHVISTLKRSRDHMESETRDWFDRLPPHVARAYTCEDQIVQIPLFVRLLQGCGYPDCNALGGRFVLRFPSARGAGSFTRLASGS